MRASSDLLPGRATSSGTRRFAERFAHLPGSFRQPDELSLSSLALGLRRGVPGGVDDLLYRRAVADCLAGGVNVFDTALSDRSQTSERALGRALARAFAEGQAQRDEIVVITKGGELSLDATAPESGRDPGEELFARYVETGIVDPETVVNGNCQALPNIEYQHSKICRFAIKALRCQQADHYQAIDFFTVTEHQYH